LFLAKKVQLVVGPGAARVRLQLHQRIFSGLLVVAILTLGLLCQGSIFQLSTNATHYAPAKLLDVKSAKLYQTR
jgi:hypothetical protein